MRSRIAVRAAGLAFAATALWGLPGCTDPCGDLAEKTCKRVGAGDRLCGRLEEIAMNPQAGDREACQAGLHFVAELERR